MARGLSAEERAQFSARGYLIKPGVFSPAELAPILACIEDAVEGAVQARAGRARCRHSIAPH